MRLGGQNYHKQRISRHLTGERCGAVQKRRKCIEVAVKIAYTSRKAGLLQFPGAFDTWLDRGGVLPSRLICLNHLSGPLFYLPHCSQQPLRHIFNSVVRFRKGGKAAIYIVLNPLRIVNVDAIGFRSLVVMTNAFQALDPSSNLGGCNIHFLQWFNFRSKRASFEVDCNLARTDFCGYLLNPNPYYHNYPPTIYLYFRALIIIYI